MPQKTDKNFVFWLLVISTIFVLILLTLMWLGVGQWTDREGNPAEPTLGVKLAATFGLIAALLISFGMFNHQKKRDLQKQQFNKQSEYYK